MQYQACIYPQIHVFKVQGPMWVSRPARTSTPCTFLASRCGTPCPACKHIPWQALLLPHHGVFFHSSMSTRTYSNNAERENAISNRKKRRHVRGSTDFFYEFSFRLTPHFSGQCDHILNFNLKRSVELKKIKL